MFSYSLVAFSYASVGILPQATPRQKETTLSDQADTTTGEGANPTADLSTIDPATMQAEDFDTETVAKLVGSTPEDKLAEAMAGPLRDVIVGEVFRRMPERLNTAAAAGTDVVVNWLITREDGEPDRYVVRVASGTCTVEEGQDPSPRVTLTLAPVTFLQLVTGNLNPVTAFMAGQIAVEGDVMFAATVSNLFEIPKGATPPAPPSA
jgi:putative sterol carrier protein